MVAPNQGTIHIETNGQFIRLIEFWLNFLGNEESCTHGIREFDIRAGLRRNDWKTGIRLFSKKFNFS